MKIFNKIKRKFIFIFFESLRVLKYKLLSSNKCVVGNPDIPANVIAAGVPAKMIKTL